MTLHQVIDWDTFVIQLKQMVLPVMVLALQTTAQISQYMRASMLDNLNQDYVRTARAKGLSEKCCDAACAAQFDDSGCDCDCAEPAIHFWR